jgi:hypothetical protein
MLVVTKKAYDPVLHDRWARGVQSARSAVINRITSQHLREIFKVKSESRRRKTGRFFGEAFVASETPHVQGYYGSFKWLKNRKFSSDKPFSRGKSRHFQETLRSALREHFGLQTIARLQQAAKSLFRQYSAELDDVFPTAPDLWLIDASGRHTFIEVKMPGDFIAPHQVAGLALVSACLGSAGASVVVVELDPGNDVLFDKMCAHVGTQANQRYLDSSVKKKKRRSVRSFRRAPKA